jgi:SAM-dependent methyltransferase
MKKKFKDEFSEGGVTLCSESSAMRIAKFLGLGRVAWALRRLHCPVSKNALVLEVGSGGNPYPRANVLLDAYEATRERHWVPLVSDRPTVLGFVENLPFRDGAFDFVIASHVLEHSPDPERFIAELQRVARAGYIETPDAFMERVNPYHDHRLEVTVRKNRLIIRKKSDWCVDSDLVELYEQQAKPWIACEAIPNHPFDFHVRYYWSDCIDHEVINPEVDATWVPPNTSVISYAVGSRLRRVLLNMFRYFFSQSVRNKQIDLVSLMQCTICKSGSLNNEGTTLKCSKCGSVFSIRDNIPIMISKSIAPPQFNKL